MALAAVCLGLALAGCYSSGTIRARRSVPTLGVMRDAMNVARWELRDTLASLEDLVESENNSHGPYARFRRDCESLETELWHLRRLRVEVATHRERFARERIEFPEQRSATEREEALAQLIQLESTADAVRDLFNPWFSNVQDIVRELEMQPGPEGLAAVADRIERAHADAGPLEDAIDALIAEIDEVARVTSIE